jgi:hypothetical protein
MSSKIFRIVGIICCLAAVVLGVAYFSGRPIWGTVATPFLMFVAGALLLIRARFTK